MALQYSVAVRNAKLNAVETATGTDAVFKMWSGAVPANCAAADSGTLLVNKTLASNWMDDAAAGAKAWAGLPVSDTGEAPGGVIGHFRIYASDGVTCHMQGTVTVTGGGGDMTVDNTNIATGQTINITSFTLTAGNA